MIIIIISKTGGGGGGLRIRGKIIAGSDANQEHGRAGRERSSRSKINVIEKKRKIDLRRGKT